MLKKSIIGDGCRLKHKPIIQNNRDIINNLVLFLITSTRKPEARKMKENMNNIIIAGISRSNEYFIYTKYLRMKYSTISTIGRKEKSKYKNTFLFKSISLANTLTNQYLMLLFIFLLLFLNS